MTNYGSKLSVPGPNCLEDTTGSTYKGSQAVSVNGNVCQGWWLIYQGAGDDDKFPDNTVADAQNLCRNVDNMYSQPMCLVRDRLEDCNIPLCSNNGNLYHMTRGDWKHIYIYIYIIHVNVIWMNLRTILFRCCVFIIVLKILMGILTMFFSVDSPTFEQLYNIPSVSN